MDIVIAFFVTLKYTFSVKMWEKAMGHADANAADVAEWEKGYVVTTERERNFKEAYGNAKTAMEFGLDCVGALQSARDICSAGVVDKIPTADALFVFIMERLAHMKIKDTIGECFPSSRLFDLPADCGEAFGAHFMSLVHAELPRYKLRECAELLGVSDRLYAMIGTLTQTECVVVLECFRYWVSYVAERDAAAERVVAKRVVAERVVAIVLWLIVVWLIMLWLNVLWLNVLLPSLR